MDYISDSDGDNTLPPLPPSAIDKDLLRGVYSFFSERTRMRLKTEAMATPFANLFYEMDRHLAGPSNDPDPAMEQPEDDAVIENSEIGKVHDEDAIDDANTFIKSPEHYTGRSLRKRTFASRHPYIADQADWLGICTIDSLNEMFTDDDALPDVARVLNQLYLKRKKRYPDEDRYKVKNFYAHLGKSKILALLEDSDVTSTDLLESNDQSQLQNYEPDDEELIPYEEKPLEILPPIEYSASESTSESEQEEQLIKIGGRYRKLSKILRGVLPESARRLDMFQKPKPVKRKKIRQNVEPRKGLAIKKSGGSSAQNAQLQKELQTFVDTEDYEEEFLPNHQNLVQPDIAEFLSFSSVVDLSSSSESDSDSAEEVFSDGFTGANPVGTSIDAHLSYLDGESDSAQEGDHINHLFTTGKSPAGNRKGQSSRSAPKSSRTSTPRRKGTSASRNSTGPPRKRRRSKGSGPAYGTLKTRTLLSPVSRRITQHTHGKIPSAKKDPRKDPKRDPKNLRKNVTNLLSVKQPYIRDPVMATTVMEVESTTKFVRNRTARHSWLSNFAPSKASLFGVENEFLSNSILGFCDLSRVHSIGDGHIFFLNEDGVAFSLVGKHYSFGLFQLEASAQSCKHVLMQLRRLLQSQKSLLNPSVRDEMHNSIKCLIKWLLILRQRPEDSLWKHLTSIFDDFSKLQTRQMRQLQSIFHSQLLLIHYIFLRFEACVASDRESEMMDEFHKYCSDFWSVFFQTFAAEELSKQISDSNSIQVDSICLMYMLFNDQKDLWWPPMLEALQEAVPVNDSKTNLMEVCYILISMVPREKLNWMPFIVILNKFRTENISEVHHRFIDICEFANQRLGWPLEEKLVTHLYASFTRRKFGNFGDENSVPISIGEIHTRLDVPDSSVFDRFLNFLYGYISSLSSKKDVKRLISKLVASSQYHYQKGRKFQIMFINRLNLILLLSQISDIDLKSQFTNLIEHIKDSRDMFIYGRAVDALSTFSEVARRKGNSPPVASFQILFEAFSLTYDSLFGMPTLFKKLIECIRATFQEFDNEAIGTTVCLLELVDGIDMQKLPDTLKVELLDLVMFFTNQLLLKRTNLSLVQLDTVSKFTKTNLSFLNSQMGRLPVEGVRQDCLVEEVIEKAIMIWNSCSYVTGTQYWNIMMLQKFPYIGNSALRERFVMFLCMDYLKSGELNKSILGEVDRLLAKSLVSNSNSKYAPGLFNFLSRTRGSVLYSKKLHVPDMVASIQLQNFRFQIMSNLIQSLSCSATMHIGEKKEFLRDLVSQMQNEFNNNFRVSSSVDFWKRLMEVIHRSARDLLNDIIEFWDFSVKLGFPDKRLKNAWIQASDDEKLQMLTFEFTSALHFGKDYATTLDNWLSSKDTGIVFSLVQLFISAVQVNDSHWAHLSFLLKYVLMKLEKFQARVKDVLFKEFMDMIIDIAVVSDRLNNSTFIMYELQALSTCIQIFQHAFFVYDGYKDQEELVELATRFLSEMDNHPPKGFQQRLLLTGLTFGRLKAASSMPYHPPYQHNTEEYARAYCLQSNDMISLSEQLRPPTNPTSQFDFLF